MNYNLLIIMIVLIILLIINSLFTPIIRENFAEVDKELPMKSINLCGRNIVFPYFSRNNFTASQRAMNDSIIASSIPPGKCRIDAVNGIVDESHSIVHENSLFYNLKYSCLAFRIDNYQIYNGTDVHLTFKTNTINDIQNITNLLLLDPLYIEFGINSERTSRAYRLVYNNNFWFTNSDNIRQYNNTYGPLVFKLIEEKGSCDKTFSYAQYSPKNIPITVTDLNTMKRYDNGILNMKVYYLDKLYSSFQNIGRKIKTVYNPQGLINVFEKDYNKYFSDSYSTQLYEFMNNIALMYTNYVYPVFTFNFSINLTTANINNTRSDNSVIWKVYMNNNIGRYDYCDSSDIGMNTNNILSASVIKVGNPRLYYLNFYTGAGNNCKTYGNLQIYLPYLTANNYINITVTVSPNEKVVLAQWQDVNSGDVSKKYVFAKQKYCSASSYDVCTQNKENDNVSSNLYDLFTKNTGNSRSPLENIIMNYDTNFVKDVQSCSLGYVNLLNEFNKK